MSSSYSATESFTITHARHLASRVAGDLYQCHRFYGRPAEDEVQKYEQELVVMLVGKYVEAYEFGFKLNEKRVLCWQYSVNSVGDLVGGKDDRSGGIYSRATIAGATYYNFMSYTQAWFNLSESDRNEVRALHSIERTTGTLPGDGTGYWVADRTYSRSGVAIERRTFRPL